jgi:hypothetical protein
VMIPLFTFLSSSKALAGVDMSEAEKMSFILIRLLSHVV